MHKSDFVPSLPTWICKPLSTPVLFTLSCHFASNYCNASLEIQQCKFRHLAHLGERGGPAEFSRLGARSATAAKYKVDASPTFVAGLTRCAVCVDFFSPLSTSLTLVGVVLGTARRVAIHESGCGFVGGPWQTVRYRAITWGNQSSRNLAGAYG